jgi:RNA polymerase sigma-70 factor (ECF subfamily)
VSRAKDPDTQKSQFFEEIVKKYEKRLYSLAYRFTGNHEKAEELSQEAFLKAYLGFPKFQHKSQVFTWLYRIMVNLCIDESRKRKIPQVPLDEIPLADDFDPSRSETAMLVREALEKLPPVQKAYIVMHDLEGFSYKEIAQVFNCPLGTVMSRISAAREKLRKIIQNDYPELLEKVEWK